MESQSIAEENYLRTINHLAEEKNRKVTPTAIAEALGHNPASVIDMIKKLVEKKLISYDKVKGAKLTEKGARIALDIIRRHRLWEVFLLEKLGYSWDAVHDIAEQLEHIHHAELADRLDKFLDYPDYDPHGGPIPDKHGKLPASRSKPLATAEVGKKLKVVEVAEDSPAFLKYLDKQDIGLNSFITVKEVQEFDQSVLVELKNKREVFLSPEAARKIFVE